MQLALKHLEAIAYLSIIGTCAILVWPRDRTIVSPSASTARNLTGKPFTLSGVQWNDSRINLVVAMRSDCHFCQESVPYYRKLVEASADGRASVIMASSEDQSILDQFLSNQGLHPKKAVGGAPFGSLGITGTPTILVVDAAGVVRRVLVGKLQQNNGDSLLRSARSGIMP